MTRTLATPSTLPTPSTPPTTTTATAKRRVRPLAAAAFLAAATLALTGCASAQTAAGDSDAAPATLAAEHVSVENAWVKAADSGMSAAFGEIENAGEGDVTIVSVASPASTALELHETVENETGEMTMREKGNGFTITPGESLTLEPGGNHIMLMDLPEPIVAGGDVTFTLTFSDNSTLDFTAPAKDFAGANETYDEGDEGGHMGGDDHDETDHDGNK